MMPPDDNTILQQLTHIVGRLSAIESSLRESVSRIRDEIDVLFDKSNQHDHAISDIREKYQNKEACAVLHRESAAELRLLGNTVTELRISGTRFWYLMTGIIAATGIVSGLTVLAFKWLFSH